MNDLSIVPSNQQSEPLTFKFGDDEIRIVKQPDSEPLFIAGDVCKALGLDNVGQALAGLKDNEKDIRNYDTLRGTQKISVITEAGLFRLMFRSTKPNAENFRQWILYEVLPSIRKTGMYIAKELSPLDVLRQMVETFATQQKQLTELREDVNEIKDHIQIETEYFTVLGYFRKMKLPAPSMNEAQSIGQRATRLSHEQGRGIGKTSDPRFGEVNSYHVGILDAIVRR